MTTTSQPPPRPALDVRTALRWAVGLWTVTTLPYVFGAVLWSPDLIYTGLMFDVPDHAQYWSWVTAHGERLFIPNTMTPEVNAPVFFNGMAWALARLQRGLDVSFPVLFQLWRLAAFAVLLPALWAFSATFARSTDEHRTAMLIMTFGGGLGWLLVVAKYAFGLSDVPWPHDLYLVEPNTWFMLLASPYPALALGLVLWTLLAVIAATETGRPWPTVAAGAGAALISAVHAYDLLIVFAVAIGVGIVHAVRTRRVPLRVLTPIGVMGLAALPMAAHYVRLTTLDPLWRAVLAQYANAGVWTPRPAHLPLLMGAPLLLAAAAGFGRPGRHRLDIWLWTWVLGGAVLIYLPTVYQVKMLLGWQVPLAVLAARAWHTRIRPMFGGQARLASATLLVLILPTNVYLYAWRFVDLGRARAPYFLTRDEAAALNWLASHASPDDVVLAPEAIGQFVPNYGRTRTFLAHWAMTTRYYERRDLVRAFFDPATNDAWRTALLEREQVTLVMRLASRDDRAVADLGAMPGVDQVFDAPGVQIYRRR